MKIHDNTDFLPNKARFVSDELSEKFVDAIDLAVDTSASARPQRILEKARPFFRAMWQCESCGRLYLEGEEEELQCYAPELEATSRRVLGVSPKQGAAIESAMQALYALHGRASSSAATNRDGASPIQKVLVLLLTGLVLCLVAVMVGGR